MLNVIGRLTRCVVPSAEYPIAKDVCDGGKGEDGQEDQISAPLSHDKHVVGGHDGSGTDELGYPKLEPIQHLRKVQVPAKKPWTVTTTSQPPMLIQPTQKLYDISATLVKQGMDMMPYHHPPPSLGAQGEYKMILSTGRRPDGCHLSETRGKGKVAEDAKDEAVDEGHGTARWEDEADGSSKGNPSTAPQSAIGSALQ